MRLTMLISAGLFALSLIGAGGCDDKKKDVSAAPAASAPAAAAPVAAAAPGAIKGSCNIIKTLGTCTEYTEAAFALGESFVKGTCTGTYTAGACPDKALGTCAIDGGQFKKYYPGGNFDFKTDDAAKECKELSNGKWTAATK